MKSSEKLPFITEERDAVILAIHVQPRASRNEVTGIQGDQLKVRLTSPPVEGAANKLCEEFLAKTLNISRSRVTIVAGEKSRHKKIRIDDLSAEAVSAVLRPFLSDKMGGR